MKDKAEFSRGRNKNELHQAYKSYADYAFSNNETRHPYCKNAADYVLCSHTNDQSQFPYWKYLLRKCTACNSIALPGVERDSSDRAPMIMLNTYMTQFTCSHHGILIRDKITTYLNARRTSKNTCLLCEQITQSRTPGFKRRRLY